LTPRAPSSAPRPPADAPAERDPQSALAERDPQSALDSAAVRRCLRGDKRGFDDLVRRYERLALYIAVGYLRSEEDARDAAQEAFIKAYRSLHRFDPESSFKAWFVRILKNACVDHYRREKNRRGLEYEEGRARSDAADGLRLHAQMEDVIPDAHYELEEVGRVYQEALATLSAPHREIIILREFEEMSYEEIAAATDAHIGTVMSRLHHARKRLQEALKPYLESIGAYTLAARAGEGVGAKRPRAARDPSGGDR